MRNTISFNEALETAEKLPIEDQETLIEILNRRIIEKQRSKLAREIRNAQKEFEAGKCKPTSADDIIKGMFPSTHYKEI